MNREDIIRMAREAGTVNATDTWTFALSANQLEHFFQAAYATGAAAEREACAKVCEPLAGFVYSPNTLDTMKNCAAAIRARGQA